MPIYYKSKIPYPPMAMATKVAMMDMAQAVQPTINMIEMTVTCLAPESRLMSTCEEIM
jgi:hypothetical protein